MAHFDAGRQTFLDDFEAVVLAGDFDPAGFQVLHWMIGAAMAEVHLPGLGPERQSKDLVAQADAENRQARLQQFMQGGHRIDARGSRVARPVGEEYSIRRVGENLFGGGARRHHGDGTVQRGETAQNIPFGPKVDGHHLVQRGIDAAVAFTQGPAGFLPGIGLAAAHLGGQVHPFQAGPAFGFGL